MWGYRPWLLGPVLLLRRGGVLAALLVAAAVSVLPAAAAPLFLSAAHSATLHGQVTRSCQWYVGSYASGRLPMRAEGPRVTDAGVLPAHPFGEDLWRQRAAVIDRAQAGTVGLTERVDTLSGVTDLYPPGRRPDEYLVNLVARPGFDRHVQVLSGPVGEGVWISDRYAAETGLRVGDEVRFDRLHEHNLFRYPEPFAETAGRVAAVYRDLRDEPDQAYWCDLADMYRGRPHQEAPVLSLAFVDVDTMLRVGMRVGTDASQSVGLRLVDAALTAPRARQVVAGAAAARSVLLNTGDPASFSPDRYERYRHESLLGAFLRRADLVRGVLGTTVVSISVAGALVGLAVVAAAGAFWVQRRRVELTMLATHGVGGVGLAVKAAAEQGPALLAGGALGAASAWQLVRVLGPDPAIEPEAARRAALWSLVVVLVGWLFSALVSGLAARNLVDAPPRRRRRRWLRLPLEVCLLAAAPLLWRALTATAQAQDTTRLAGAVIHVPPRVFIVPLLTLVAVAVLGARLVAIQLLRVRRSSRPSRGSPASLLAKRRAAREPLVAAALVASTAIPIALGTFGAVVTGSVRATLHAEGGAFVGADAVVTLERPTPIPAALSGRATPVTRLEHCRLDGLTVDVLAVDLDTFARDASWDARIDRARLSDLVLRLRDSADAAVGSRSIPPGAHRLTAADGTDLGRVNVNEVVRQLPAEQGGYPVLLIRADAVPAQPGASAVPQWWVRGDPARLAGALTGVPVRQVATAEEAHAHTIAEPLIFSFGYLSALSLLTGLIGAVGLVLYLESRTPRHRRAYVLLRRMGLRVGTHLVALTGELSLPLLAGLLIGAAGALGQGYALRTAFDVDPGAAPDTVFTLPLPVLTQLATAVVGVGAAAVAFAHWRVASAHPREVLADTG